MTNPCADTRENRGFHAVLEHDHPYTFIDGCVQIWPDADLANAHLHGATVYGVTSWRPHADAEKALEGLMYWHLVARRHPNLLLIESVDDIHRAKAERRAGLLLASQDGEFIGTKLHRIEAFWRLGMRMMIPAYNRSNFLCGGVLDRADGGLTSFGRRVVEECDRLGVVLDCSHIGRRSSLELIDASAHPVVFSHANARRLVDNPRNIDDEQIRACAERGGVIGAVCWGPLIFKQGSTTRPTLADFLDHIDYLAQLLGNTDAIGIGTDFSLGSYPAYDVDPWGAASYADVRSPYDRHVDTWPRSRQRFADGFSSYPEVLGVIDGLERRGYGHDDIGKILGGNFLRVFEQIWSRNTPPKGRDSTAALP